MHLYFDEGEFCVNAISIMKAKIDPMIFNKNVLFMIISRIEYQCYFSVATRFQKPNHTPIRRNRF